MDYQQILSEIYREIQPYAKDGKVADYIPALAQVNPDCSSGICITTTEGETFTLGQADTRFSIQSITSVRPFHVPQHHGKRPMEKNRQGAFFGNSVQLAHSAGSGEGIRAIRSSMPGAIVLADILLSHLPSPEERLYRFHPFHQLGSRTVDYNRRLYPNARRATSTRR